MLLLVSFAILVTAIALENDRSIEEKSKESWKGNFTPYIYFETVNDIGDEDSEKPRVSLCCHIDAFLNQDNYCIEDAANETETLQLTIYGTDLVPLNITTNDFQKHFSFVIQHPCAERRKNRSLLIPYIHETEWYLLSNGSILRVLTERLEDHLVDYRRYCLARVKDQEYNNEYVLILCIDIIEEEEEEEEEKEENEDIVYLYALLISVPFLIATYFVYWLLPDLNNLHGLTLRRYVGCMAITNCVSAITHLMPDEWLLDIFCIVIAIVITFSFSASFFWLNVMCFDIWLTFGRKPRLSRENIKQRKKKRFMMYSIYAWGSAFIHTVICVIMDFAPIVPNDFIKPQFFTCWFSTDLAEVLYFWALMSIIIICNICLFISTMLKILCHRKNVAQHLKNSESRRHDDNKQRFSLYFKLFIIMGISWSMEIISWIMEMLFHSMPEFIWYISSLTNILQGLIIFIICVWKDKIWHLLLKRLGCQDRDFFCRKSTSNNCSSSVLCFSAATSETPMQTISTDSQTYHAENSSNKTYY